MDSGVMMAQRRRRRKIKEWLHRAKQSSKRLSN
jgi:hypothetical protein